MNKHILVSLIAFAAFASITKGMDRDEPQEQEEHEFQGFTLIAQDLSWMEIDAKYKELDETLKLVKPARKEPVYSVLDIALKALGVRSLAIENIGDNPYGSIVMDILADTYVRVNTENVGIVDGYDTVHVFHTNAPDLRLLLGEEQKPKPKPKLGQLPVTVPGGGQSGPGLSWLFPTLKYTSYAGVFLTGIVAVKAYQWFKNK